MSSSSLVTMFNECVDVLKARRSRKTVKNGLENLIEMDFSVEMANEVDLKTVIRNIFTYDPFEEMKDTLIAKVELLEAAYKEKTEREVESEAKKTSGFENHRKLQTPASGIVMKSTDPAKKALMLLPATSVMPLPLMSLQVERPTWLSEKVLRRYYIN